MNDPTRTNERWQLRPLRARDLESEYPITEEELILGRDPTSDIVLEADRYPHVSGQHARVRLEQGKPAIEDLGSKNGTYANGRRIEAPTPLNNGDVVQLGSLGPSFVVFDIEASRRTVVVPTPEGDQREFGRTTILHLKRALGLEEAGVEGIRHRHRRLTMLVVAVSVMLVGGMAFGFYLIQRSLREGRAQDRAERRQLWAELEERWTRSDRALDAERNRFEELRASLARERDKLRDRILELEEKGRSSAGELGSLREQLSETDRKLELFDPVNLSKGRLEKVANVLDAVVLIEASCNYVDRETGDYLYVREDAELDGGSLQLGPGSGKVRYTREGTGSGFCVSPSGWIITNAHVVTPEAITLGRFELKPTNLGIEVVFTGEAKRLPARVASVAAQGDDDLALIAITPFEGMPVVEGFSLATPTPGIGSEVYLFGFPLGKHALQENDRVIASTFKGILSREVEPFLQIDAAVYPGNSGGPVVDDQGRVVGITVGVQTTPGGTLASAIGYVIPIRRASLVWPPPTEAGAPR